MGVEVWVGFRGQLDTVSHVNLRPRINKHTVIYQEGGWRLVDAAPGFDSSVLATKVSRHINLRTRLTEHTVTCQDMMRCRFGIEEAAAR